jgi:hypothetical protein
MVIIAHKSRLVKPLIGQCAMQRVQQLVFSAFCAVLFSWVLHEPFGEWKFYKQYKTKQGR